MKEMKIVFSDMSDVIVGYASRMDVREALCLRVYSYGKLDVSCSDIKFDRHLLKKYGIFSGDFDQRAPLNISSLRYDEEEQDYVVDTFIKKAWISAASYSLEREADQFLYMSSGQFVVEDIKRF